MKQEKKLSRFDLFTQRKRDVPGPVENAKEVFTFRGDRYSDELNRQMKYLLGIVRNYKKQYVVMIIRDNEKKHEVLKMLNGKPMINRLPDYAPLLNGYHLPEYLSYEISEV